VEIDEASQVGGAMGKNIAKVQRPKESVFVVIGDDGATNVWIAKGTDGSGFLIDTEIGRLDEIDDALISNSGKAICP
jgi:hypothetical protein